MRKCCDGDCDQGRLCPHRKPLNFLALSVMIYNKLGWIAAGIGVVSATFVIVVI